MRNAKQSRRLTILAAAGLCVGLGFSAARAATVAYWQFDDQAPGTPASTLATQVNSPALNGTAHAAGSGANPVHNASTPGMIVHDGAGVIYNAADSASLKFTNPDAPLTGATGSYNGGYVSVPDASGALDLTSFTVEGFVRIGANNHIGYATLVGKSRSSGSSWEIDTSNDGHLRLRVDSEALTDPHTNGTPGFNQAFTTGFNLEDDQWHHFAVTYDATTNTVALFGDYQQVGGGTLNGSNGLVYDTGNLNIGEYNGGRALDGYLDEIRLSNTVLRTNQFLTTVPEPASAAMLGLGALCAAAMRRRRA